MRVHHALRNASTALIVVSISSIMMGMMDLEVHYTTHGRMIEPEKPSVYGLHCLFTWNFTADFDSLITNEEIDGQQNISFMFSMITKSSTRFLALTMYTNQVN